ncbi:hypothetical protein LTR94_023835 [Friedmanniomyces endolithicus]|nr:hypothetical protein LTR94_023835 [Friedmanniomyces endolithicus]
MDPRRVIGLFSFLVLAAEPSLAQTSPAPTPNGPRPYLETAKETAPENGRSAILQANREGRVRSRSDLFEGAMSVFDWSEGHVFEVWTAPFRVTTLLLGQGETLLTKAAGDTVRWQVGEAQSGQGEGLRSLVLIKPLQSGLETNLVLTTDQRIYLVALKSGPADAFNAAVRWNTPQLTQAPTPLVPPATAPALMGESKAAETTVAVEPVRTALVASHDYRIEALGRRPSWTPRSVFDDGERTTVVFDAGLAQREAPVLFVLSPGGERQMVNYRQEGERFVVDRLFDRAELRLGDHRPEVKGPAPGLDGRAPRPPVVRLRRSVIQILVGGGALLVAGSLTWAFVVQPQIRQAALKAEGEDGVDETPRTVRPSELVVEQPASYDRLPPPRTLTSGDDPAVSADDRTQVARDQTYSRGDRATPSRSLHASPSLRQEAQTSGLFFGTVRAGTDSQNSIRTSLGPDRQVEPYDEPPVLQVSDSAQAGYNPNRLTDPLSLWELKAGTIVPAALLTAIDTSRPGPVVAAVSQGVRDTRSGQSLLIPQGTRLVGRHDGVGGHGDRRAFIVWERLILPNGKSLTLQSEQAVDAQGSVGVSGRVDRRIGALATATLFSGAITTLGQMARDDNGQNAGFWSDAGDAAAIEASRVGGRLIDRELEIRPVIRVAAGGQVRVMITRDLILEPYAP